MAHPHASIEFGRLEAPWRAEPLTPTVGRTDLGTGRAMCADAHSLPTIASDVKTIAPASSRATDIDRIAIRGSQDKRWRESAISTMVPDRHDADRDHPYRSLLEIVGS
jgi:hypothetical protein